MKTLKITARARERGLNLVELMTGLAVIGILSTIAYPSFVDSLREGRRADAYSTLMFTANNLERWFSTNHTYTSDVAALGLDVEGTWRFRHREQLRHQRPARARRRPGKR